MGHEDHPGINGILDATWNVIQEMGYENLNVDLICREAAIPRSTFYANFSDVQEVVGHLVDRMYWEYFNFGSSGDLESETQRNKHVNSISNLLKMPRLARELMSRSILETHPAESRFSVIRSRMHSMLETSRIAPLVEQGVDEELAICRTYAMLAGVLAVTSLAELSTIDQNDAAVFLLPFIQSLLCGTGRSSVDS